MTTLALLLLALPAVVLSEEHQAMVNTSVGDTMPALQLFDTAGRQQPLAALQGERATVLAVMGGPAWMTETLINDLGTEVADKYGDQGIRAVAVSLSVASPLGPKVTSVRADRAETAKLLGEGRMPRIFVLNSTGEIVWFDVEYSLSTHRELLVALDELTAK